jgi:CRISPR/Cas system CSM-associated protein Csm3 (group 7 of RAMP superfamily)
MFDLETLPRGVRWPFLLELDLSTVPDNQIQQRLLAITVRVLQAWADKYCWLGGGIARGLGWFRLDDPKILPLRTDDVWPDAFAASPYAHALQLEEQRAVALSQFTTDNKLAESDGDWRWQSYTLTLSFYPPNMTDDDVYGTSALSIGSHAVFDVSPPYPGDSHLIKPLDMTDEAYKKEWKPEQYIAATGESKQPFIPGSALRGPLRHRLEWWLNRSHASSAELDLFRQLFGTEEQQPDKPESALAAALLICDAILTNDKDWRIMLLPCLSGCLPPPLPVVY